MNDHVSVNEAARRFAVAPRTIYEMIWAGRIPGVIRIGRAIRIPVDALDSLPEYAPPKARSKEGRDDKQLP